MLKLEHPNIMKLFKAIEGKRKFLMVMEYVGKATLHNVIETQKTKVLTESRKILISLNPRLQGPILPDSTSY